MMDAFGFLKRDEPTSLGQIDRRRAMLDALVARTRNPQTFESGLGAVTAALAHRLGSQRLDDREVKLQQDFSNSLGQPNGAPVGPPGGAPAEQGGARVGLGRLFGIDSDPSLPGAAPGTQRMSLLRTGLNRLFGG